MNGRTQPFRHPAFQGRRIVVTATGLFIEARTGREIGEVRAGSYYDYTREGAKRNPAISRLVECEFGPLIARLKLTVKPPRLLRL